MFGILLELKQLTMVFMYKKILICIGISILFLGVGIQPAIALIQQDGVDVGYFDVTTEFIGLEKEYTTQLTKDEIEELDTLFNSISLSLNKSETLRETAEIFKDAVLKLDGVGLLGDVGIKETEKLVTSFYKKPILMKGLQRLYNRVYTSLGEDVNRFCFITGKTKGSVFLSPIVLTLTVASMILMYIFFDDDTYYFDYLLAIMALTMLAVPSIFIPFCLVRMIGFEDWAEGTIVSFGLNGLKSWNGKLKGIIKGFEDIGVGVFGFTGLKIEVITSPNQYLLGFATHVHIEES